MIDYSKYIILLNKKTKTIQEYYDGGSWNAILLDNFLLSLIPQSNNYFRLNQVFSVDMRKHKEYGFKDEVVLNVVEICADERTIWCEIIGEYNRA